MRTKDFSDSWCFLGLMLLLLALIVTGCYRLALSVRAEREQTTKETPVEEVYTGIAHL